MRKNDSRSQCAKILGYMHVGGSIDQRMALKMFGCARLAARIYDLKCFGWTIKAEKLKTKSGKLVSYYYLPY